MNGPNTYITATEVRNKFFDVLEQVKKGPYPINITVRGIPQAVIVSKEDYDAWMATIETLSDPELMESIRESEEDLKAGRYTSLEEVEKELGIGKFVVLDKGKKKYVSGRTSAFSQKRLKKA